MKRRLAHAQQGLSLIELMIAMLISTFLVLGATQVYLDNQRNYQYQQGQSSNQAQARVIQLVLERELSRAGFAAEPYKSEIQEAASQNGCPAFSSGQAVAVSSDGSGLCYHYEASVSETDEGKDVDCLGTKLTSSEEVISRISYVASSTAGGGSLVCTVDGKSVTLVDGLADFVFFTLPAPTTSKHIAVRYAALLSTATKLRDGVSSDVLSRWKTLSGNSRSDDQYLYHISQGSVTLRNWNPDL